MPKISNPRDNIVDEYEIVKILRAVKDDRKLLFAVAVAYLTGARISEIIMLRPTDFSEQDDLWIVSVPTLKQRVKIHGKEPKRTLPIRKEGIYLKIIKPYLDKQIDKSKTLLYPETKKSLGKKIKIRYPDVYFHWFRHTRATIWSRKLQDIFKLQYAMGWKDIRMANIYVHQQNMTQRLRGEL